MSEDINGHRNEQSTDPGDVGSYGHAMILPPAGTAVIALVLASSAFLLAKKISSTNAHRSVFTRLIPPIDVLLLTFPSPLTTNTDALNVVFIRSKKSFFAALNSNNHAHRKTGGGR